MDGTFCVEVAFQVKEYENGSSWLYSLKGYDSCVGNCMVLFLAIPFFATPNCAIYSSLVALDES